MESFIIKAKIKLKAVFCKFRILLSLYYLTKQNKELTGPFIGLIFMPLRAEWN
ncbi:MAG: hypothetical protein LBS02_18995 [Hungatella sp.]|jgi:hypothetical protein|nr:hypothetical protein [Hungatella sp.]